MMRIRAGFVTNSSSTGYYITNITNEVKTIVDFAKESIDIFREHIEEHGYEYTEEEFIMAAQKLHDDAKGKGMFGPLRPGIKRLMGFGDEDGTVIGHVFDYALRDGGKTKSFVYS